MSEFVKPKTEYVADKDYVEKLIIETDSRKLPYQGMIYTEMRKFVRFVTAQDLSFVKILMD